MSQTYPILVPSRKASGAIPARRLVALTTTAALVILASTKTQTYEGVSGAVATEADGEVAITSMGIVPVEYGGVVAVGDPLTSDSVGRAVKAVDGNNTAGVALEAGTIGTIGTIFLGSAKRLDNTLLAALVSGSLGSGTLVDHADASPVTLLAAHATKDRAVLVIATCTESLAGSDAPTFNVGWTADTDGLLDELVVAGATAGQTFIGAGVVPATNAIIATLATGGTTTNDAGKFHVAVLALPTT